jgi:DNA-binding response OmpR family regulator
MLDNHILVIEDDENIREVLSQLLGGEGYLVTTAETGTRGLKIVEKGGIDLVLLDLKLPDIQGESVCKEIKKMSDTPVIMLTAKSDVHDIVHGLKIGADDYIAKPFETEELLTRIQVQLRGKAGSRVIHKIGDLELNTDTIEVTRAGKKIILTPQEFKLLEYLMKSKGKVLTRDMILNKVWLYGTEVESRVVDVYIGYLRKKIDKGFKKKIIKSIRGFGYTIAE